MEEEEEEEEEEDAIPWNAADNVREDRFLPLGSKLPLLIGGISMRNGEGEKRKKNLERNKEREREKFGREEENRRG